MKAVYIENFGGPENLLIRNVPDPATPSGTRVLVRVRAAGLNRADLLQRKGLYPAPPGYSSNIPGLEYAGEVVNGGDFPPGTRVMGITAGEAQAEFVSVDGSTLAVIPDNLTLAEAAAIPEAFITAHDAIFAQAQLRAGETLLVHAVGSGVGLAALQMAKAKGARVIGTSRTPEKLDRCSSFGMDEGIVVSGEHEFSERVMAITDRSGADVILDLVGAGYFQENLASLAMKGRLMLVGLTAGSKAEFDLRIALYKRLKIIGTVLRARTNEEKAAATKFFVEDVLGLFANGTLRPNVDRVFPMEKVSEAHRYLESNESFGKVVLEF